MCVDDWPGGRGPSTPELTVTQQSRAGRCVSDLLWTPDQQQTQRRTEAYGRRVLLDGKVKCSDTGVQFLLALFGALSSLSLTPCWARLRMRYRPIVAQSL